MNIKQGSLLWFIVLNYTLGRTYMYKINMYSSSQVISSTYMATLYIII